MSKIYKALKDISIGTILTKQEIIKKIQTLFPDTPSSSVTPQDACYNKINVGRTEEPLFEWIKFGHYKYLGKNYKYNGDITHDRKGSDIIEKVGYWENGIKTMTKEIINSKISNNKIFYPDEITEDGIIEGAKRTITVNSYERSPDNRKRCLELHGFICQVCSFDFEKNYGSIGKEFIHVHHIKPLGEVKKEYEVDPSKDLIPVCPNCHAMIHRYTPALTIDELKTIIKEQKYHEK